jgi:hypothetical protein
MHQRIGVNQLDGTRGTQGRLVDRSTPGLRHALADRFGGRQNQQGPQTFAAIENRIAHGLAQARRGVLGDPGGQRTLDPSALFRRPGLEIKSGAHACVHGLMTPSSSTRIWFSTFSSRSRQNFSSSAPRW